MTKSTAKQNHIFIRITLFFLITLIFSEEDQRLKIINAETLEHTEINGEKIQTFKDSVVFQRGSMEIFTQQATYYPHKGIYHLLGPTRMTDISDTLTCDHLRFLSGRTSILQAMGNVVFYQENRTIYCDTLFYWIDSDSAKAFGDVEMTGTNQNIKTKRLTYKKTDGYRGLSFTTDRGSKFVEGNLIISAEIIHYNDHTQEMNLVSNSTITEPDKGMIGDEIQIQFKDSLLSRVAVSGNATAFQDLNAKINQTDKTTKIFRNEMSAHHILGEFHNNKITILSLLGMATTNYHLVQNNLVNGVNLASGDTIKIDFLENKIDRIQVFGGGRGQFTPENKNTKVDSVVIYSADYLDYHVKNQKTILQGSAVVEYQGTELTSGHIIADWNNNLLNAAQTEDQFPAVTTIGSEPMSGEAMEFNLVTRHGKVDYGKTRFNEGSYMGNKIFRDEPDIYHVQKSIYTTCDLDPPHFCFASDKMKMIADDRVVARPLILYIYDIPVFGVPLAVFPNKGGGRRSGWIMPNWGSSKNRGTYIQGLGYYWAPNDYIDTKLKINFGDKRGMDFNGKLNYKKRYRYNGNISTTIFREIISNEIGDFLTDNVNEQWKADWNHSHIFDPTQHISVSAHYVSSNTINQDYGWDLNTRLNQRIQSHANYSKNWPENKNSLSISLSDSYDLLAETKTPTEQGKDSGGVYIDRTQILPGVNFRHGQSQIFGKGKKSKWYHTIYGSMSSNYLAQQKIGLIAQTDSTWENNRDYSRDEKATHTFSLSSPQNLFGWLNLNPSLNLKEDWVFKYLEPETDSLGNFTDASKEINKFRTRLTGSFSVSAGTKIYGVFPVNLGPLEAVRHVLTPSVSFSWRPDFSNPIFGYDPGYVLTDNDGEVFDRFKGSMAGSTPTQESKLLSIRLNNELHVKVRKVDEKYEKIKFLTWNMSTRYNAVADSLKFSPITSSVRATIPGIMDLDISMAHDPYRLSLVGDNYKKINEFLPIPRLISASTGTSFRFSGGKFNTQKDSPQDTTSISFENISDAFLITPDNESTIPQIRSGNLWETSISLRYSLNRHANGNEIIENKTVWANANLRINLTQEWILKYNTQLDLVNNEMVGHSFNIYRKLHCWEFQFHWRPSGPGQGFMLKINVLNPDLRDIKLRSTGGGMRGSWG